VADSSVTTDFESFQPLHIKNTNHPSACMRVNKNKSKVCNQLKESNKRTKKRKTKNLSNSWVASQAALV
jgi:hypothetical protein